MPHRYAISEFYWPNMRSEVRQSRLPQFSHRRVWVCVRKKQTSSIRNRPQGPVFPTPVSKFELSKALWLRVIEYYPFHSCVVALRLNSAQEKAKNGVGTSARSRVLQMGLEDFNPATRAILASGVSGSSKSSG
jgi:hypothetical protein